MRGPLIQFLLLLKRDEGGVVGPTLPTMNKRLPGAAQLLLKEP